MKSTFGKIWNIVTTVLVAAVVIIAILLMGFRIFGYKVYTVISPSMTPTYEVGDLIYVKYVDPYEIKVGDPITFILNENLVVGTHRVVRIDAENQHFYTKGDANNTEDIDPVHFNNVIGVPQFKIPKLGYVSNFVQNPPGTYIAIGVVAILILLVFAGDLFRKKPAPAEAEAKPSDEQTPASADENAADKQ